MRHPRKAFTLIELVIVIAILGIIAVIAMPRFRAITPAAQEAGDLGVIESLKSAIRVALADQMARGDTSSPLDANPFTYLQQAPPYKTATAPTSDGVHWIYAVDVDLPGVTGIGCPHLHAEEEPLTGMIWYYQYLDKDESAGRTHEKGAVWLDTNLGHGEGTP